MFLITQNLQKYSNILGSYLGLFALGGIDPANGPGFFLLGYYFRV